MKFISRCGEQHINQTWVALNNYDHVDFNICSSCKINKLDTDVVQLPLLQSLENLHSTFRPFMCLMPCCCCMRYSLFWYLLLFI